MLDTHLLIWTVGKSSRLSTVARSLLSDPDNQLVFSSASIWEIAIKASRGRQDFEIDPRVMRRGLFEAGYIELAVTSEHAFLITNLPHLHKDPFDRILIAQARSEGITLLTVDAVVAQYPGTIVKV